MRKIFFALSIVFAMIACTEKKQTQELKKYFSLIDTTKGKIYSPKIIYDTIIPKLSKADTLSIYKIVKLSTKSLSNKKSIILISSGIKDPQKSYLSKEDEGTLMYDNSVKGYKVHVKYNKKNNYPFENSYLYFTDKEGISTIFYINNYRDPRYDTEFLKDSNNTIHSRYFKKDQKTIFPKNAPFYFMDVNLDGENELVLKSNNLEYYSRVFYIYSFKEKRFLKEAPFDRIGPSTNFDYKLGELKTSFIDGNSLISDCIYKFEKIDGVYKFWLKKFKIEYKDKLFNVILDNKGVIDSTFSIKEIIENSKNNYTKIPTDSLQKYSDIANSFINSKSVYEIELIYAHKKDFNFSSIKFSSKFNKVRVYNAKIFGYKVTLRYYDQGHFIPYIGKCYLEFEDSLGYKTLFYLNNYWDKYGVYDDEEELYAIRYDEPYIDYTYPNEPLANNTPFYFFDIDLDGEDELIFNEDINGNSIYRCIPYSFSKRKFLNNFPFNQINSYVTYNLNDSTITDYRYREIDIKFKKVDGKIKFQLTEVLIDPSYGEYLEVIYLNKNSQVDSVLRFKRHAN